VLELVCSAQVSRHVAKEPSYIIEASKKGRMVITNRGGQIDVAARTAASRSTKKATGSQSVVYAGGGSKAASPRRTSVEVGVDSRELAFVKKFSKPRAILVLARGFRMADSWAHYLANSCVSIDADQHQILIGRANANEEEPQRRPESLFTCLVCVLGWRVGGNNVKKEWSDLHHHLHEPRRDRVYS
jgi:hypothetical protein